MLLLLVFAFLAGFVTILAPCIWPVLPIVLSSAAEGRGHKRPLGITLGVIISFAVFTLTVSTLVRVFHLDANILRLIAVVIIASLGLMMIFPALYSKFEILVTKLSNVFGIKGTREGNDFWPGFITGLSLGIVWSPCAGPILATIATLAATGKVNIDVILVTIAYVIGVGIPLFAFAYGGQKLISKLKNVSQYTGKIQQVFGVIMILAAWAILTNYDQTLQLALINKFPILGNAVNGFENSTVVINQLNVLKGQDSNQSTTNSDLLNVNTPAPDFVGITNWINTGGKQISIKDLKGKVVLVDFWTYTCINCIRTLPHVVNWYNKYKNDGFVVVGIHTPEFQFEHDTKNVENAVKTYNITYPVGQDNDYSTWNNFSNNYWPAEYLIDATGNIRRTDFGEGNYDKMETAIQQLLKGAGQQVGTGISDIPDTTPILQISPETYLGNNRSISNSDLTLSGNWAHSDEYITAGANAAISYNFTAGHVYIILRPVDTTHKGQIQVFLDDKLIDIDHEGADVKKGIITVDSDRLYNVVDLHGKTENHVLKLQFLTPGIQAYTFTFG